MAIKLYDQMEVVPTYQSFVMICWVGLGLLIFGEYSLYEFKQILGMVAALVSCLIGVKFLAAKHKSEAWLNRNDSADKDKKDFTPIEYEVKSD